MVEEVVVLVKLDGTDGPSVVRRWIMDFANFSA